MALRFPAARLSEQVCQRRTPRATAARSSVLCVLVIALATAVSCSCPGAPSITSLSPSSASAGGSAFVLTINGNNFVSYSALNFNGTSLIPTFVSSHQLVATIPAAAIAQPGPSPVFVLNPPTGGTTSAIGGTGPTT